MKLVLTDSDGTVIDMWNIVEDGEIFYDLAHTSIAKPTSDTIMEALGLAPVSRRS